MSSLSKRENLLEKVKNTVSNFIVLLPGLALACKFISVVQNNTLILKSGKK